MRALLAREDEIAEVAAASAPYHRYWAMVGNGANRVAAAEIRIKLSELCYKAIACDATEDKKHIDLSSEPMILICAAGLEGGVAADVGKEIEIFAAHKAHPIVIASDSAGAWRGAAATIRVPDVHRDLAFLLSTMAGHLYGYHAARAIDAMQRGTSYEPPPTSTLLGGLMAYLREPTSKRLSPMNVNFGLLPPLADPPRKKPERKQAYGVRAQAAMREWLAHAET